MLEFIATYYWITIINTSLVAVGVVANLYFPPSPDVYNGYLGYAVV